MKNQMNLQNYAVISLFLGYGSAMRANISTHGGTHDDVTALGDNVKDLGSITSADETPAVTPHRGSLKLCGLVRINAVNKITFFYCLSHSKIFYLLNISELSTLKNVTANDLETSYILFLSQLCNIQRTL